ncbi:hypothetical protein ScPMuIL_018224 [Solemya velum]
MPLLVVDPSVPRHDFYESADLPSVILAWWGIRVTARLLVFVCFVMSDDLRIVFYHWLYDFDFYVCDLYCSSLEATQKRHTVYNFNQRGAMRLKHAIGLCIMANVLAFLIYKYGIMKKAATNISKQYEQEKLLSQTKTIVDLDKNDKKRPGKLKVHEKQLIPDIIKTRNPREQYKILYRMKTSLPVGFNDSRVPSNIASLKSQRLIDVIRDVWIEPPSDLPYNFNQPKATFRSQLGQDKILDEMMKYKTDGFFLEAGAADGEEISNTLFFETERNWTGLLIEPDPVAYTLLQTKHRKAYSINCCLAANVSKMEFHTEFLIGGLHDFIKEKIKKSPPVTLQCFPLHAIMQAINHKTVDLFSLDVEGAEPHVLRGIDFNKVDIKVLVIESVHCGSAVLREILEPEGYQLVKKLQVDDVFVKMTEISFMGGVDIPRLLALRNVDVQIKEELLIEVNIVDNFASLYAQSVDVGGSDVFEQFGIQVASELSTEQVKRENGQGPTRTLHRNFLLAFTSIPPVNPTSKSSHSDIQSPSCVDSAPAETDSCQTSDSDESKTMIYLRPRRVTQPTLGSPIPTANASPVRTPQSNRAFSPEQLATPPTYVLSHK